MKGLVFLLLCGLQLQLYSQLSPFNNALLFELNQRVPTSPALHLLVEADIPRLLQQPKVHVKYQTGSIASISCDVSVLGGLIQQQIVRRAESIPANKQPLNDTLYYRNRVHSVKVWTAPLTQAYDGKGVLMGIIDTGIDFTHPDFKDAQGNSRVLYLWDQTIQNPGLSPQPYNYGQEWNAVQIDAGLCNHSDALYYGHGTGVSGLASGNAMATGRFEGVAPASDLIVVALDFSLSGPSVADAVHYIAGKALLLNRPFVINASLGSYYGSHDATDLESKTIENIMANIPGRVMVAAAGNAGHIPFHTHTQVQNGDTAFTWIKNNGLQLEHSLYGDLEQVQHLQFSVGANRTNYSYIGNIGFKTQGYALNTVRLDTLKNLNNQRIALVESAASVNSYGVYELTWRIQADSSNLLWSIETRGDGQHDAWNFDLVNAPLPLPSQYPAIVRYASPDSIMNMVSGFQCSDEVLTVANYVNTRDFVAINNTTVNSNQMAGALPPESSSGPTRDGRQKPDISATGNNVTAPMCLFWQSAYLQNFPQIVAEGSLHIQSGGTSAASPIVAGLAALYLQKNPNASNREIIDAVRFCAYHDLYTGNSLPHPRWGYGKLDGKASLLCNDRVIAGQPEKIGNQVAEVFPNPFSTELEIHALQPATSTRIQIFNPLGQLLFEQVLTEPQTRLELPETLSTYRGLLLIRLNSSGVTRITKLIKE